MRPWKRTRLVPRRPATVDVAKSRPAALPADTPADSPTLKAEADPGSLRQGEPDDGAGPRPRLKCRKPPAEPEHASGEADVRDARRDAVGGSRGSVARTAPVVGERSPRHRDELPAVARPVEREPEDAEGVILGDLAVGLPAPQAPGEERATGAHHELADASGPVQPAASVLRREPLVVVAAGR